MIGLFSKVWVSVMSLVIRLTCVHVVTELMITGLTILTQISWCGSFCNIQILRLYSDSLWSNCLLKRSFCACGNNKRKESLIDLERRFFLHQSSLNLLFTCTFSILSLMYILFLIWGPICLTSIIVALRLNASGEIGIFRDWRSVVIQWWKLSRNICVAWHEDRR